MSLPTPPTAYNPSYSVYNGYSMGNPSGSYDSLGQPKSNSAYSAQFTPSPGMYSAPRQENYEMSGYRPRYNSVAGISSDTRSQMPAGAFARRPSNIEQNNSLDTGLSGISSSSSSTPRITNDPYLSQGYYNAAPSQQGYAAHRAAHRALPTPTQQFGFERTPQSYHSIESGRENMWSLGTSSSPHGQYVNSQSQQ